MNLEETEALMNMVEAVVERDHLSIAEITGKLGITSPTYYMWKNGRNAAATRSGPALLSVVGERNFKSVFKLSTLGQRLRYARLVQGLTVNDAAELLHVNSITLNDYEQDIRDMTADFYAKVTSLYGELPVADDAKEHARIPVPEYTAPTVPPVNPLIEAAKAVDGPFGERLESQMAELAPVIEKGRAAWKDVPDATAWVEAERGNTLPELSDTKAHSPFYHWLVDKAKDFVWENPNDTSLRSFVKFARGERTDAV